MSSIPPLSRSNINQSAQSIVVKSGKSMTVKLALAGITLFTVGLGFAYHYWRKRKVSVTDKTKDQEPPQQEHRTRRNLDPAAEDQIRKIVTAELESRGQPQVPKEEVKPRESDDTIAEGVMEEELSTELDMEEESTPGTPNSAYGDVAYTEQVHPPSP